MLLEKVRTMGFKDIYEEVVTKAFLTLQIPPPTEVIRLYDNRIGTETILCTDSHKSYIQFSADMGLEHKQIRRGRHKEDIYHIQHINSLHSNLKGWMRRFNGVATKYLSNYMKWHKWMGTLSSEKEIIRTKNLLVHSNIPHKYTKVKEFKTVIPNFV